MNKKKILLVFGTRPEAIKMLPLYLELLESVDYYPIICLTGQHKELLKPVLDVFNVKPKYNLALMKHNQDLFSITSDILISLKDVFKIEEPDLVMVHGDTTTSMSAALSSFYFKIPVAHIEAGLRSHDKHSPFPEELNRNLTSKIANYHFAPTNLNRDNLLNEGIDKSSIYVTGNTGIDALKYMIQKLSITEQNDFDIQYDLSRLSDQRKLILITGHRRENFGEGFKNIFISLKELANKYPQHDFVYPMHLNPNVRNTAADVFSDIIPQNLFLIDPLGYVDFIRLMQNSYLILTDSGGIQEEAPALGKPVLVMRENTERPEGINIGTCILVGTDKLKIIKEVSKLLDDQKYYKQISKISNPFGNGESSKRIVKYLKNLNF